MNEPRIYNRVKEGVGGGQFAEALFREGELARGELQPVRELTDTERAFTVAQQGLIEQRARLITASTTLVIDERLKELEDRGDKVVSITAMATERIVGNPEWFVTSMLTADGRNLVTGMHLDVNSAEARVINMLECIGDDGAAGIPSWFEADANGEDSYVNLDKIRAGARELGVADDEATFSRQRKEMLNGIIEQRELAGSEYTLAAAALVTEGILADHPDTATIRFRYEDGAFFALAVKDSAGSPIFGTHPRVNQLLNKSLDFSDLCAKPIDASGDRADTWFNKESLLLSSWEWNLREVQETAENYR